MKNACASPSWLLLLWTSIQVIAVTVASSNEHNQAALEVARLHELLSRNSSADAAFDSSSLRGRLAKATDLMERGILDVADAGTNITSASVIALKQVSKEFPRLKKLWTRLDEQHSSEIQGLRAEVERERSARDEAERLSDLREKDHAHMQTVMNAEMAAAHQCAKDLKRTQLESCKSVCSNCTTMRQKDGVQIKKLVHDKAVLQLALTDAQKSCNVNASRSNSSTKLLLSKRARVGQSTATDYVEQIEQLKTKEADVESKAEDTEDDRDALAGMVREMHATNEKLQADNVAQQKLISKLQREVEVLSSDKGQLLDSFRAIIHENGDGSQEVDAAPPPSKTASMKLGNSKVDDIAWMGQTAGIDKYIDAMYSTPTKPPLARVVKAKAPRMHAVAEAEPLDRYLAHVAGPTTAPALRLAKRPAAAPHRDNQAPRAVVEVAALAAADVAAADYSDLAKASLGKLAKRSADLQKVAAEPAAPTATASVSDLEEVSHLLDGME